MPAKETDMAEKIGLLPFDATEYITELEDVIG